MDRWGDRDGEREAERGVTERRGDLEYDLRSADCVRVGERPRRTLATLAERDREREGGREPAGIFVICRQPVDDFCSRSLVSCWGCHCW